MPAEPPAPPPPVAAPELVVDANTHAPAVSHSVGSGITAETQEPLTHVLVGSHGLSTQLSVSATGSWSSMCGMNRMMRRATMQSPLNPSATQASVDLPC